MWKYYGSISQLGFFIFYIIFPFFISLSAIHFISFSFFFFFFFSPPHTCPLSLPPFFYFPFLPRSEHSRELSSSSPTQSRWVNAILSSIFFFFYCYDLINFKIVFLSLYSDNLIMLDFRDVWEKDCCVCSVYSVAQWTIW